MSDTAKGGRFRAVTYNIHKALGVDRRVSIKRIASVLAQLTPDIVALQEVMIHEGDPSPELNQAQYIADELEMSVAIGDVRKLRGARYGNVTLSRFPIHQERLIDLSIVGREERGMLRTDIGIDSAMLHVFNLHLGTAFVERRRQAEKLLTVDALRATDIGGPRIVMGDFNEWTTGMVTRVLRGEFEQPLSNRQGWPRAYPGIFPVLSLDHIYCDRHFVIEKAFWVRSRAALIASDHLPLVADLRLIETREERSESPSSE